MKRIEGVLAKRRKEAGKGAEGSGGRGKKKNLTANLPEGLSEPAEGEAREKAAAAVGMGARTAEKAADVVDAIDAAEEMTILAT